MEQTNEVVFSKPGAKTTDRPENAIVFDGGDAEAFRAAIETAIDNPGTTLSIDPGTYHLGRSAHRFPNPLDAHFEQVGLEDVTIEGNGARFLFTDPTVGMLHFYGGGGLTIRDLTLDYDPTPFTQAQITSFSPSERSLVVEIEDGYPTLEHPMFEAEAVWASTHTSNGEFVSELHSARGNSDKEFSTVERIGERRFKLTIRRSSSLTGLAEGRRLAIVPRSGHHALHFADVDRPTIRNVTVRASIAFAMHFAVCTRPVVSDCTIGPRAGADRLIGSNADGIHCKNGRVGPLIEGCDIHHLEDDGIVVSTEMTTVTEVVTEDAIAVESTYPFTAAEGDTLAAMRPSGRVLDGLPAVENVEYRFKNDLSPGRPRVITFESSIADGLQPGDYVLNRATANHGYEVRNNRVRDNRASLVRLASGQGELIANDLAGSSNAALELECDTRGKWAPKGWLYDVVIAENTISRAGLNYIHPPVTTPGIHLLHRSNEEKASTPHRDVTIRDNEVTETGDIGIQIEDATEVTVTGNDLSDLNKLDVRHFLGREGYGIGLANVSDVEVTENSVIGRSVSVSSFGWQYGSSSVAAADNDFVVDEEPRDPSLVSATRIELSFSHTTSPDGLRSLSFMCYELAFLDEGGDVLTRVDVGGDESGLSFGQGVYSSAANSEESWRWFGGPEAVAILIVPSSLVETASRLRLNGVPVKDGITARTLVDGDETAAHDLGEQNRHTVELPLP